MNIFSNLLPAPLLRKRRGGLIKTSEEIAIMRQASRIVATVLKEVGELVEPGMTTADLDAFAEKRIRGFGATPTLRATTAFPLRYAPRLTMKSSMEFLVARKNYRKGMS
jgi:methionyl aminopeptidase